MIDWQNECGRMCPLLIDPVNLEGASPLSGWGMGRQRFQQRSLQGAPGSDLGSLPVHPYGRLHHLLNAGPVQRRSEANWSVWNELELAAHFPQRLGLFDFSLHHVPLVYDYHNAFVGVQHLPGYVGVLAGYGLRGVGDKDAYVGTLDGPRRPQHAVLLYALLDTSSASHSRRIHQDDGPAVEREGGIDGVPCSAGDLGYNGALISQDGVEELGLAHVGAPNYCQPRYIRVLILLRREGQLGLKLSEQVVYAQVVIGANQDGVPQTQLMELHSLQLSSGVVHLVHHKEQGLLPLPQRLRYLAVARGDTRHHVH